MGRGSQWPTEKRSWDLVEKTKVQDSQRTDVYKWSREMVFPGWKVVGRT